MHFFQQVKELGYSEYDIAKVKFLFKMLIAEVSKLFVFSIIWWHQDQFPSFCAGISIFFILRACSGGLHFQHYWTCFLFSFIYLILCINFLPMLVLPRIAKLCCLFLCMILAYKFSPVVSKYRNPPSATKRKNSKREIFVVIFLYFLFMYITPQNPFIDIGFWCIVIHTVQLSIAYFVLERREKHEKLEKEPG